MRGGEQGAWTDIYSVGAVGYKMITGENPPEAVSRVKDDKIKDLSLEYRGEYSKELLETIDACLRMDENERPRSIVEVLEMLRVGREDAEVNRSRKVVNKNYVGAPRLNANVWNRDRVARAVEDSKVRETYAGQGDRLAKFDNGAIWHYTKVVLKETIFFLGAIWHYTKVVLKVTIPLLTIFFLKAALPFILLILVRSCIVNNHKQTHTTEQEWSLLFK